MAREQLVFNYVATEHTAPNLKNASTEYWEATFEIEGAWITVMNYLNAFGWTQSGLVHKMESPNIS